MPHDLAAGFRRHDAAYLAAERTAARFDGLPRDLTPGRVLAAFKRAARPLGISRAVVALIDQLFAHTKPQDWEPGATPIVWPRNETLAEDLDVSVRQLQNLFRRAIELRLIAMKDSGNGHRGGHRGANGAILWAYGIDLRPLGTRHGEFVQAAAAADVERRARDALRRRLTIARKGIAQIAQTALEAAVPGTDWVNEAELARMAAGPARQVSDLAALTAIVERLEARREALLAFYQAHAMRSATSFGDHDFSGDITPTDEAGCTDSTTTTQPFSSNEQMYWARREEGSGLGERPWLDADTPVTRDLERYGISADFIAGVCRETCWELAYGEPTWEALVRLAQRQAADLGVSRSAWREAVRLMGERGAAAAMVAIAHKARDGLVERPGAYLRGMSARATSGELSLGRTFHGIREARAAGTAPGATPGRAFRNAADVIRRTAAAWRASPDS